MIGFSDIQPPVVKLLPKPISPVALLETVRAVDPENRTEGRLHLNRAGFLLGALQPRRGRTSPWQLAHWPAWASRDVVTDDASLPRGLEVPTVASSSWRLRRRPLPGCPARISRGQGVVLAKEEGDG